MRKLVFFTMIVALALGFGAYKASAQITLVSTGSVWKYLDDGSDQGTGWRTSDFPDGTWASGPAELGFGDNDEATVINGGPTNARIATVYFRHAFGVVGAASITNLTVRLRRDDGGIVYLNDMEVFRSNLPQGDIFYNTYTGTGAGSETAFFSTNVEPALLLEGPNILAVEIHQQNMTSSDMSFELELVGNIPPAPPTVTIVNPTNGATLVATTVAVNATATVTDQGVTVAMVQFYSGGTLLGSDSTAPYNFAWTGVAPGNYTLTAVATDSRGLTATSAPVNITVTAPPPALVQFGSSWKYLDDGSEPPFWTDPSFIDSGWATGIAELGYGDDDEATIVSFGPDPTNKFITTYFRHHFTLTAGQISSISNLVVRLLRDDGGIAYLNGTEILRSNMPDEPITAQTLALATLEDGLHSRAVDRTLLAEGENVLAVEIHQATNDSSDISFDLQLQHNVPPTPPTVSITSPTNGATFITPVNITINATATDADGTVTLVEFFAGATKVGEDDTAPYSIVWSNAAPGNYALTARATDETGFSAVSPAVNIVVISGGDILVATGSDWKYLDDGSDQTETLWKTLNFADSGWSNGLAQLGYGDNDEVTEVRSNRLDGTKILTTYFRHVFNVPNASIYSNLIVRLQRDDGGIVYLNEVEVFRSNMPTGAVNYLTEAAGNTTSETAFFQQGVNPALLNSGNNIIAVEIHQQNTNSSDISFDLTLIGNAPSGPPTVAITSPTNSATLAPGNITINATASDTDGHITLVEFFDGATPIGQDLTAPYSMVWSNPVAGAHTLTAKATDNAGLMTTSAPVNVTVLPGMSVTFRQGLNSYAGTQDTELRQNAPDTAHGATNFVLVDNDLVNGGPLESGQGLLRFDDIVGTGSNQVPPGATIVRATLTIQTDDPSSDGVNLHRMLVTWDEASTWNSMTDGVSANDVEAQTTPDVTFTNNVDETTTVLDVTARVQAWVNGQANFGWALLPTGGNGYRFDSSEAGTAANRPALIVTFTGGAPTLQIERAGSDLRISWGDAPDFILEESTSVSGPWSATANQSNPQLVSAAGSAKFYRLHKP